PSAPALPAPSHSTCALAGAFTAGGVVSTTVMVDEPKAVMPQASLPVNFTVAAPVLPHAGVSAWKSLVKVTALLQASLPVAAPRKALTSPGLPAPSHSTCRAGGGVTVGAVVSTMVNTALVIAVLPHSSLPVNFTVAAPDLPHAGAVSPL